MIFIVTSHMEAQKIGDHATPRKEILFVFFYFLSRSHLSSTHILYAWLILPCR